MKTIIETLWQSLETGPAPASGIVLRRFPADFFPEINAALRLPGGHPAFAIRLPDDISLETLITQNFRDLKISFPASDPTLLLIELQNPALREIFAVLCDDLASHLKYEDAPAALSHEIRGRLYQWSLLFEKAAAPGLSPEEQRGLFGELIFLKMLLENTPNALPVLNGWLGTSGGIQDFFFADRAIEVKTTFGNKHQTLVISNAAQLDDSGLAQLWLAHFALETPVSDAGKTLNEAVAELLTLIEKEAGAVTRFRVKLAEAGYFDTHAGQYEQPAYQIRSEHFYEIKEEFPRIRTTELRPGIETLKYSIRVADCQRWRTDFPIIVKNLPALSHEPHH